ncbi:MAG: hypothetical protein Q8P95_02355, partial [bacterium]|nr:hypothetical protein [bacterium]
MRARLYLLMLVIMLGAAVFVGYRYFDELSQYLNAALVVQSDPDDSFLAPATGGELTAGREIGLALGSGDVLFAAYRAAVNNGIFVQQINDVPPMVQNGLSPDLNTDPGNASGGPDIALDEDNQAPQVAYVVYRKEDPNNNHEVRKIDISGSPPTTFAGTNALILGAGSGAEPTIAVRSGGAEVLVVYGAGGGPGAGVAGPLDLVRFDGNLANNNNPLGVSGGANVTLRPDIVIDDANDRAYVVFVDDDGVLWIAQVDISPAITEDPTLVATVSVAGDDAATSRPSARLYNSFLLVTYTQENAGAGTDELSLLRLPLIPDIAGTQPTVIRNVGSNVVSPSIVVDTSSTPDYAHIVYGNINDPDQGDGSPLLNAIRVDLSSFSGFSDEVQDLAGEGMVTTLETVFDPASGNIYSLFEEFGGGAPDLTKTNVFVAPLSTESPASSGEIDVVLSDALIASFDEVLTDVDDGDMVLYSNWRGFIPCDTSDSA